MIMWLWLSHDSVTVNPNPKFLKIKHKRKENERWETEIKYLESTVFNSDICILYTINIWYGIITLEPSMIFYVTYDQYAILCHILWQFITVICNIMLNPNLKLKKIKIKIK